MLCSSKSLLLPLTNFRFASPARVRASASLPEGDPNSSVPNSGADDPPEGAKEKRGSGKLNRWAAARALRSGRKLGRRADRNKEMSGSSAPLPIPSGSSLPLAAAAAAAADDEADDDQLAEDGGEAKTIFLVSDRTGWTAEHAVNAALGQFEQCLVQRLCPVSTHLFSGIDDMERLMEIIKQAAKEGALLLYTLADPSVAEAAKNACRLWGVPFVDVLGPIIEAIAAHLGVAPSGAPGRNMPLSKEYFRRIEAIDFTIKQDDGVLPQNLSRADIVLVGVSRSGKTPLSIYLAQKGYKVANVPLVLAIQPPEPLFRIDQEKIFALKINPGTLRGIRRSRAKSLGFTQEMRMNYSDLDHVRQELEFVSELYAQNPLWPVIEVTGKAVEETAAVILRILHDRKDKHTMPRITKRY